MIQTAHINNWTLHKDFEGNPSFLEGEITGHVAQEHFHSAMQRTSSLLSFDEEKGVAESQNTMYTLGTKAA